MAEAGVGMCRPVWNQLFSRKSCLPNALSTEYCKAGAQEALHCKANIKVHVRHTQRHSKQREAQQAGSQLAEMSLTILSPSFCHL